MSESTPTIVVRDRRKEEQERSVQVKRFQYHAPEQSPNDRFCDRCKLINFDAIFTHLGTRSELQQMPMSVAVIGNIDRSMLQSACSCCVFWAQIVFLNKDYPFDEVTGGYLQAQTCRREGSTVQPGDPAYHKCLKLLWSAPSLQAGETWTLGPLAEHLIFPAGNVSDGGWAFDDSRVFAQCVDSDVIGFCDIVSRLDQCRTKHANCKKRGPLLAVETTLIDCEATPPNLVSGPIDVEYVALSYCLGIPQLHIVLREDEAGKSLVMEQLPQTIRDAILLTRELKMRYLWVDAICIDQEDTEQKHILINKMDRVYSNADLVLVAQGEDVDSGFYGVSVPRVSQPVLHIGSRTLVSKMSDLRSLLQMSRWSTRGWTYQEALLARRCVIFTSEQWHFVCRSSSAYESLIEDLPLQSGSRLDLYALRSTLFRTKGTNKHDLEVTEDVREYTVRDLSLDSDFLNAFRGVLRRSGLFSLVGVIALPQTGESPISPTSLETGFALGLFWAGQDRSFARTPGLPRTSRRSEFPTWSWLSSRGVVDMTWSNPRDYIPDFSEVDIHASFSVKDGFGGSSSLISAWLDDKGEQGDAVNDLKTLELQSNQHLQITTYVATARFIKPTQPVMLAEYWFDLDRPLTILTKDGYESTNKIDGQQSGLFSAMLHFASGEHRPIGDHENIVFDKEAFSDPSLAERILTDEFELALLVSHAFEQRQLNYWIILDKPKEAKFSIRIGTARSVGYRYELDNAMQQNNAHYSDTQHPSGILPKDFTTLRKTTRILA